MATNGPFPTNAVGPTNFPPIARAPIGPIGYRSPYQPPGMEGGGQMVPGGATNGAPHGFGPGGAVTGTNVPASNGHLGESYPASNPSWTDLIQHLANALSPGQAHQIESMLPQHAQGHFLQPLGGHQHFPQGLNALHRKSPMAALLAAAGNHNGNVAGRLFAS